MNLHLPATATHPVLHEARAAWALLAGPDASFLPGRTSVAVAPASRLSPPGWTAVVVLGDAALVTVADARTADRATTALRGRGTKELAGPGRLQDRLPFTEVLGPPHLLFLTPSRFRPVPSVAEGAPADDPSLLAFLDRCGPGDADESALAGITSPARAVRWDGRIVAAADMNSGHGAPPTSVSSPTPAIAAEASPPGQSGRPRSGTHWPRASCASGGGAPGPPGGSPIRWASRERVSNSACGSPETDGQGLSCDSRRTSVRRRTRYIAAEERSHTECARASRQRGEAPKLWPCAPGDPGTALPNRS